MPTKKSKPKAKAKAKSKTPRATHLQKVVHNWKHSSSESSLDRLQQEAKHFGIPFGGLTKESLEERLKHYRN